MTISPEPTKQWYLQLPDCQEKRQRRSLITWDEWTPSGKEGFLQKKRGKWQKNPNGKRLLKCASCVFLKQFLSFWAAAPKGDRSCRMTRFSVHSSVSLSVPPFICLSVCLFVRSSICPFVRLSVHPFVRLSVRPFVCLSVRLFAPRLGGPRTCWMCYWIKWGMVKIRWKNKQKKKKEKKK